MQFGLTLPNFHYGALPTRDHILDVARAAEASGFTSVWASDHILVGSKFPRYGTLFEALTTLGWVGAQTERIQVGTSILVLPLRNAILAAKQLATIDALTEWPRARRCRRRLDRGRIRFSRRRLPPPRPRPRRSDSSDAESLDQRQARILRRVLRIRGRALLPEAGPARRTADLDWRELRRRHHAAPRRWATVGTRTRSPPTNSPPRPRRSSSRLPQTAAPPRRPFVTPSTSTAPPAPPAPAGRPPAIRSATMPGSA